MNKEQRSITMREALLRDIADLKRERDEAREALREVERENDQLLASNKNYERDWPVLVHERDEAIAARKSSAADWLCQVEQANARVSRALQQVALAERERDAARAWSATWKNAARDWRRMVRDLWRRKQDLKAELSEWQTLRLWGAKPQNIHDFIKSQQVRIHETQDMETTCKQLERERDKAREDATNYFARLVEVECERDAAREDLLTARRHCSLQGGVIEYLRDQLCADKCRDKAAADGGWGNL